MFVVPIGNAKDAEEMKFNIYAQMLKYRQDTSNSCCFSRLASEFESINQVKAVNYISKRKEESRTSKVGFSNCIDSANDVVKTQKYLRRTGIILQHK